MAKNIRPDTCSAILRRLAATSIPVLVCYLPAHADDHKFHIPEDPIPGEYVVLLPVGADADLHAGSLASRYGVTVRRVFPGVPGFSVAAEEIGARDLAQDPDVELVEQNSVVALAGEQLDPVWGLDRIDQRQQPLDGRYVYADDASDVHVFVLDTGIRWSHDEFTDGAVTRVSFGFNAFQDNHPGGWDCHGHGTHVAGTVGGETYGVAKDVTLHPVRVLGCNNFGTTETVLAGVDWVNRQTEWRPAVANMSLRDDGSPALDAAVLRSIEEHGITYVVAAGNDGDDACNYSPGRLPEALSVAASDRFDARPGFSNFGACVDLFAPGTDVLSAWHQSDASTAIFDGTSVATPHVAGAAALVLQREPSASPAAVHDEIVTRATRGVLTNLGPGSPDRLLLVDDPPVAGFTVTCQDLRCRFTARALSSDDHGIVTYRWRFGDGGDGTGAGIVQVYPHAGTYTARLRVFDTVGQSTLAARQVTVTVRCDVDPCQCDPDLCNTCTGPFCP